MAQMHEQTTRSKIQQQGVSSARLGAAVLEISPALLAEKDPAALK